MAPTLAAALGVRMPPTAAGHVLPVVKTGMAPPRVVVLIVLDGMRRDYFYRYATLMPTLTALRQRGAWFTQAQLNILPSSGKPLRNRCVGRGVLTGAMEFPSKSAHAPVAQWIERPPPKR